MPAVLVSHALRQCRQVDNFVNSVGRGEPANPDTCLRQCRQVDNLVNSVGWGEPANPDTCLRQCRQVDNLVNSVGWGSQAHPNLHFNAIDAERGNEKREFDSYII